jgi:hypothetical protein
MKGQDMENDKIKPFIPLICVTMICGTAIWAVERISQGIAESSPRYTWHSVYPWSVDQKTGEVRYSNSSSTTILPSKNTDK